MDVHVDRCVSSCLFYAMSSPLRSVAGGWCLTYLSVLYESVGLFVCLIGLPGSTTRVVVNLTSFLQVLQLQTDMCTMCAAVAFAHLENYQ